MTQDEPSRRVRRTHEDAAADFFSKVAGVPLDEAKELVEWALQHAGRQPGADAEPPINDDNAHA